MYHHLAGDLDEILGDGVFEETVGAPTALAPLAPRSAYAVQGRQVAARKYSKARQYTLPLSSTAKVTAATQQVITNAPQVLFRAERLVIADPNNYFTIQDLKVGKNSQFAAAGSVPSAVYANGSFGVRLKCDTCQVSMQVAITVTNTDNADHLFSAAVIGPAIE